MFYAAWNNLFSIACRFAIDVLRKIRIMKHMKTTTQAVLAGAYADQSLKSTLTHLAEMSEDGFVVSVLCNRVKAENLMDDKYSTTPEALAARPTCKVCGCKWDKLAR